MHLPWLESEIFWFARLALAPFMLASGYATTSVYNSKMCQHLSADVLTPRGLRYIWYCGKCGEVWWYMNPSQAT